MSERKPGKSQAGEEGAPAWDGGSCWSVREGCPGGSSGPWSTELLVAWLQGRVGAGMVPRVAGLESHWHGVWDRGPGIGHLSARAGVAPEGFQEGGGRALREDRGCGGAIWVPFPRLFLADETDSEAWSDSGMQGFRFRGSCFLFLFDFCVRL